MCSCVMILIFIIIFQLFRLSNNDGFANYPINQPGIEPTAPRHVIDPVLGIPVPMFSVKSAVHPVISRKLIVPKNWDDKNRHLIEYKLGKDD